MITVYLNDMRIEKFDSDYVGENDGFLIFYKDEKHVGMVRESLVDIVRFEDGEEVTSKIDVETALYDNDKDWKKSLRKFENYLNECGGDWLIGPLREIFKDNL